MGVLGESTEACGCKESLIWPTLSHDWSVSNTSLLPSHPSSVTLDSSIMNLIEHISFRVKEGV